MKATALEIEPTSSPERSKRSKKLIKPGIQLRLAGLFAGLTVLCLLLQWLTFSSLLSNAASAMPVGGDYLVDLVPGLLFRSLLISMAVALPLTLLVGVHATHRLTGPIYRFENYLREVAAGTQLGPCKIREGDEFSELCAQINAATEPVRRREVMLEGCAGKQAA
jgi:hypothetical protein